MAKYLVRTRYTVQGLQGLIKEGGTSRRDAVEKIVSSLGGTLEAYYYAFGDTDLFFILDLPDNVRAAAGSLIGNAPGTSEVMFTVLLTPEEMDAAADVAKDKMAAYRPPGQ
jgi:uncharacterized protein with GYD domain